MKPSADAYRPGPDWPFYLGFTLLGGLYVTLILAMLLADVLYTTPGHLLSAFSSREIRYSIWLSLLSCSITTILALWIAVPLGYLLSRVNFPGNDPESTIKRICKHVIDTILDIPIVIPPLVVGLSLLILFQTPLLKYFHDHVMNVTYAIPSVILAQFAVATAFAVRTMRVTFDQIPTRAEDVALTLGCSRGQAFWRVTFPEARRGLLTAGTLAWARSLGEFGPILIFSGATRMRTEVLSTTVFLELSVGRLSAAIAVSLLMVIFAVIVLVVTRVFGLRGTGLI